METGFPPEYAHIKLIFDGEYQFSFGYPVEVQTALAILEDRLTKTAETNDGENPAVSVLSLIMEMLPSDESLPSDSKIKLNMMLCGLLFQLSKQEGYEMKAQNLYELDIRHHNEGIMVEMHNITPAVN